MCTPPQSMCFLTLDMHTAWIGVCNLHVMWNTHSIWNRRCSFYVVIHTVKNKKPKQVRLSGSALDFCLSVGPVALISGLVLGCSKTLSKMKPECLSGNGLHQGLLLKDNSRWEWTRFKSFHHTSIAVLLQQTWQSAFCALMDTVGAARYAVLRVLD